MALGPGMARGILYQILPQNEQALSNQEIVNRRFRAGILPATGRRTCQLLESGRRMQHYTLYTAIVWEFNTAMEHPLAA